MDKQFYNYNKYKNKLNNENIIENRNLINKSEYIMNNHNTYNNYYWKVFFIEVFDNVNDIDNNNNTNLNGVFKFNNENNKYLLDDITQHKTIIDDNTPFFIKSNFKINDENVKTLFDTELLGDMFIKNGKKFKKITLNNTFMNLQYFFNNENNKINYLPYKFVLYQKNPDFNIDTDNPDNEFIPVLLSKSLISNNKVSSFLDFNFDDADIITNHKTFKITFSFDKYLSFVIDDIQYLYNLFFEYFNGSTTITRQREIKYIIQTEIDDNITLFPEYTDFNDFINNFDIYNNIKLPNMDLIYE